MPPEEIAFAAATAARLGMEHRVVRIAETAINARLPEVAWAADEPVTDEGLANLKGLNRLLRLDLKGTPLTDAGLKHLRGVRNLKELNLFDTQIAAALLGMPAQIGYAGLVKELFDVEIHKTHTRADWSRRPLRRCNSAWRLTPAARARSGSATGSMAR